jgi:hypothetical protein
MKRVIIVILLVVVGAPLIIATYLTVKKHLQTACYSNSIITSETEAIEEAKRLVIRDNIFNFPQVGTSGDFIASLMENPQCCGG